MKKITFLLLTLLLFNACSLKTPKNDWQRKSTHAFNSYTKNFLSANDALAYNDLSRAIKHAKQSADLTQLAKIYLGECALNISSGSDDICKKYTDISNLLDNKNLDSYYSLITRSIKEEQIKFLPSHYKNFASTLVKKDFKAANVVIQNIEKTSSSFLCASLIKEELFLATREKIIKSASYSGYKKIILFWLEESKKTTKDKNKLDNLNQKISILNSNK